MDKKFGQLVDEFKKLYEVEAYEKEMPHEKYYLYIWIYFKHF
jgi:hypothetical protein